MVWDSSGTYISNNPFHKGIPGILKPSEKKNIYIYIWSVQRVSSEICFFFFFGAVSHWQKTRQHGDVFLLIWTMGWFNLSPLSVPKVGGKKSYRKRTDPHFLTSEEKKTKMIKFYIFIYVIRSTFKSVKWLTFTNKPTQNPTNLPCRDTTLWLWAMASLEEHLNTHFKNWKRTVLNWTSIVGIFVFF